MKSEALWVLCNSARNSTVTQIDYMINMNILDLFADHLNEDEEATCLIITIEAIHSYCSTVRKENEEYFKKLMDKLTELKIVDKIEDLQNNKNNSVYSKAYKFITAFTQVQSNL